LANDEPLPLVLTVARDMAGVTGDGKELVKVRGVAVFRNGVLVATCWWTDVRVFICVSFELTADC
jgi:hypothetical protein